jgi:hypothetical protein
MRLRAILGRSGAGDSALIRAEAAIALYLRRADALPEGEAAPLLIRADRLDRFIATKAPRTLVGAAVKLRRLLDPETGLRIGGNALDVIALAQVLALLTRVIGPPKHKTRPTCNAEQRQPGCQIG